MFTALHPKMVKNLILLAAGIDFSTRDGLLNLWTDPRYFNVDAFVDAFGNCPAEYLQACFLMLKPVREPAGQARLALRTARRPEATSTSFSPWKPG